MIELSTLVVPTLRQSLVEYYRVTAEPVALDGWHNTLETNSGYVERRAAPLVSMLEARSGVGVLEGACVLDAGCGFGALSVYLAAKGAVVHGVDPNGRRLAVGREVAERHRLPVTLRPGRMESHGLPDESVDVALVNNSLCYVVDLDERRRSLEALWRVIRPGGLILVRNPSRLTFRDQFTGLPALQMLSPRAAGAAARLVRRKRSTVRLLTPRAARRELEAAGFDAVEHVAAPEARVGRATKLLASYQHLLGARLA